MTRSRSRAGAALAAAALASVALLTQSPAGAAEPAAAGTQPNAAFPLDRIDQRALPTDKSYSWSSAGAGVRVYVVSDGINTTHTDFGGRASQGADLVGTPYKPDCGLVGTGTAGLVAGQKFGVAKEAHVVSVRVTPCYTQPPTAAQLVAGINWVTRNAAKPAVAVLPSAVAADASVDDAVKASIASGITWVVSAGYGGKDGGADACTFSPSRVGEAVTATQLTHELGWPGEERLAFNANRGPCVDLAGTTGLTAIGAGSDENPWGIMGGQAGTTGGAAAILLGANPSWTPAQVHQALVDNATTGQLLPDRVGTPNRILYSK